MIERITMPVPVVPLVIGGGLAALLFAGKAESKAAAGAAPSSSATPTQASTGGPDGGAQMASHADVQGEINLNVGGRTSPKDAEYLAPPVRGSTSGTDPAPIATAPVRTDDANLKSIASGVGSTSGGTIETGQESAFSTQSSTPLQDAADRLGITTGEEQVVLPSWLEIFGVPTTYRTTSQQIDSISDKSGAIY